MKYIALIILFSLALALNYRLCELRLIDKAMQEWNRDLTNITKSHLTYLEGSPQDPRISVGRIESAKAKYIMYILEQDKYYNKEVN